MKTSRALFGAGDVLRAGGWCQCRYTDGKSFCVLGAIAEAVGVDPSTAIPAFAEPRSFLALVTETRQPSVWNDEQERTASDAMFALDAAYVLALQEEGIDPAEVLK